MPRGAALGLLAVLLAVGACSDDAPAQSDAGQSDAAGACDQLAARYVGTAADLGYCSVAADCWAYAADCAITTHAGAPTCTLLLNQEADKTQFADMSLAWQTLGCPTTAACDGCNPVPTLDCRGGACVAVQ
jgi:hypothetical protein